VNSVEPYIEAVSRAVALSAQLRQAGFEIDTLDIGGGFGADYEVEQAPEAADYADAVIPLLRGTGLRILMEPGRSIAANAGILVGKVLFVKQSGAKKFVIVDAAMTDLIRPALYQARHFAWPVRPGEGFCPPARKFDLRMPGTVEVDIVGPVCESSDFLAKDRYLPPLARDDYVAIFSTGAYGFVMSSQYNSRPRAPEVLVAGDSYRVIRRRETYEDLIAAERL